MTTDVAEAPIQPAEAPTEETRAAVVTIATCTLGKIRIEWASAVVTWRKMIGMKTFHKTVMGYTVSDARNVAIHETLADGSEFMIFWDDDLIPHDSTAIVRLITEMQKHPEIDVLGAVYPPRREITEPLVIKEKDQGIWYGWEDGKIHKVFFVGTALMAIRMSSLAAITDIPTYKVKDMEVREWFYDDEEVTDDFHFANMCLKHGLNVYVHGGVKASQIDLEGKWFHLPGLFGDNGVIYRKEAVDAVDDERPA